MLQRAFVRKYSLLLGFVACCSLAGCNSRNQKDHSGLNTTKNKISAASFLNNRSLKPEDKAEALAKTAEQLLTVQGFTYANQVADLSLQQDPTNLRAQFVKAILAPIMPQQGILTRVAPLADLDANFKIEYNKFMHKLQTESTDSTLKSFLLDGKPDIQNERDIQKYIDSITDGFSKLRVFSKINKDSNLTVMASDAFFKIMEKRFQDACTVVETSYWEYEYECPSALHMLEVTFNRADFEGLQQIAAGYELYYSLYNSYDLSGSINVIHSHFSQNYSAQQLVQKLFADASFGRLRASNGFVRLKEMGVNVVTGMRWILKNQDTLCPLGSANPKNRIGALFNSGLCLEASAQTVNTIETIDRAVSGKLMPLKVMNQYQQEYLTIIKPISWMTQPMSDLRRLTPLAFDHCQNLVSVSDETVGDLLPNADANRILHQINSCAL